MSIRKKPVLVALLAGSVAGFTFPALAKFTDQSPVKEQPVQIAVLPPATGFSCSRDGTDWQVSWVAEGAATYAAWTAQVRDDPEEAWQPGPAPTGTQLTDPVSPAQRWYQVTPTRENWVGPSAEVRCYSPVVTDLPVPMPGAVVAVLGTEIWVIGGTDSDGDPTSDVRVLDAVTGLWSDGPSTPTARSQATALIVDGRLWVVGGVDADQNPSPAVEFYDPVTGTWASGAPHPAPRAGTTWAAVGNKIVTVGGVAAGLPVADMHVYDPTTGLWSDGPSTPTARSQATALIVDGRLWVVGGVDADQNPSPAVEFYDPVTGTWASGAPHPAPRAGATWAAVGTLIWSVGGSQPVTPPPTPPDPEFIPSTKTDVYDTLTATWAAGPDMSTPRVGHVTNVVGTRILVAGGINAVTPDVTVTATVESLDTTQPAPVWETRPAVTVGFHQATAASDSSGNVFVVGGRNAADDPLVNVQMIR